MRHPWMKRLVFMVIFVVVAVVCLDIGWRLRGRLVGVAPLERTIAMSTHPDIPKTVHVYWVPTSVGVEVRGFVYEGGVGIVNYGHDLGALGQAAGEQAAARQFGIIRWTSEGLRIGAGTAADRIVLTPADVQSLR